MKQNYLIKTLMLLVALVGGVSFSWADDNGSPESPATGTGTVYAIPTVVDGTTAVTIASKTETVDVYTYHYASLYRSGGNNNNTRLSGETFYFDGFKGTSYVTFNLKNDNESATPIEISFKGATKNDNVTITLTVSDRDGSNAVSETIDITDNNSWDPISNGNSYTTYFHNVGTGEKLLKIDFNGHVASFVASLGEFVIKKVAAKTTYTFAYQSNNNSYGTVASSRDAGTWAEGSKAKLTATRVLGYKFVNWTNASTSAELSTSNPYTHTIAGNITIQGNFATKQGPQTIPATSTLDNEMASKTGGSFKEVSFQGGTVVSFDNFQTGNSAAFALNNTEAQYYKIVVYTANNSSQQPTSSLTVTLKDKDNNTIGTKTFETAGTAWGDWIERSFITSAALPTGTATLQLAFTNVNVACVKVIATTAVEISESSNYTPEDQTTNVNLTRNISAGKWNTLVLPFSLTGEKRKDAFGENVKFAKLNSYDATNNELGFAKLTAEEETVANQPYMVYLDQAFTSYTFENVTVETTNITDGKPTQNVSGASFIGTYSVLNSLPGGCYYISNNEWCQAASTNTIKMKGTRAYFTLSNPSGARLAFHIDEGETTAIGTIKANGETKTIADGVFYNINGQRVSHPTKGLYIVNGKKVIIK